MPVEEADKFLKNSDQVVGVNINGDVRAYPLQILVWHEIVNDNVGSTPVAITYCPHPGLNISYYYLTRYYW